MDRVSHGSFHCQKCNTQDLKKVVRLLVGLSQKTQGECRDGVVTPGSEKSHEEHLTLLFPVSLGAKVDKENKHTLESKFLSRLRRSESSGAVIRLLFRFCTMILANSMSCCTEISYHVHIIITRYQPLLSRDSQPMFDRCAQGSGSCKVAG